MSDQTTDPLTEEDQKEDIFLLEDVQVQTLGLVERGAVDETFFLLKSREDSMADQETEITEIETGADLTPLEQLGAERLQTLLELGKAAELEKAGQKKPGQAQKMLSPGAMRGIKALLNQYGDELPDDISGRLADLMGNDDHETEMGSKVKTEKDQRNEVTEMAETEVKTDQSQAPPEEETPVTNADQPTPEKVVAKEPDMQELLARLEKAETTHAATVARLEKAETELAKAREIARQEREARERIVHIEKARAFNALGINPDEMGGFLHRLAQADKTANLEKAADAVDRSRLYEYIESVLKAANEQIVQAGFFREAGSSKVSTQNGDLVQKAQAKVDSGEYQDLRSALLAATDAEAEAYLGQFEN